MSRPTLVSIEDPDRSKHSRKMPKRASRGRRTYEKYEEYSKYEDYSWRDKTPRPITTDKYIKVTSVIKKRNGFLIKNIYGHERWMTFFEKLLYKWFGKRPRF